MHQAPFNVTSLRQALGFAMFVLVALTAAPAHAQVLEPGDEVEVRVPGNTPEKLTVSADGTIDLKSYGQVALGGKTIEQARDALRKRLAQFIKNPAAVQIKITQAGRLVLITGKVENPGMIRVGKNDDLWQAISKAGGAGQAPIPMIVA